MIFAVMNDSDEVTQRPDVSPRAFLPYALIAAMALVVLSLAMWFLTTGTESTYSIADIEAKLTEQGYHDAQIDVVYFRPITLLRGCGIFDFAALEMSARDEDNSPVRLRACIAFGGTLATVTPVETN